MKLNAVNGKVSYIMIAGADSVKGEMPLEIAQKMLNSGAKKTSTRFPGYPCCVDNKYFFDAKPESAAKTNKGKKK